MDGPGSRTLLASDEAGCRAVRRWSATTSDHRHDVKRHSTGRRDEAPRHWSSRHPAGRRRAPDRGRCVSPDERIPVAGPWVTDLEVQYVAEAAANDWYANAGQSVGMFEREFAAELGVAPRRRRAALHVGAAPRHPGARHRPGRRGHRARVDLGGHRRAAGLRRRDPGLRRHRSGLVVHLGRPRSSSASRRGPRRSSPSTCTARSPTWTRSGRSPRRSGLPIIEDAAQSIGSSWNGRQAGTLGDVATFSFHGTKTLTTGEGGMLVTDRTDLFERVAALRDHGRTATDFKYFVTNELAYKYRMSSLQAAFGRAQLVRLAGAARAQGADLRLVRGAPRRPARRAPQPSRPVRAQHVLDGHGRRRRGLRAADARR